MLNQYLQKRIAVPIELFGKGLADYGLFRCLRPVTHVCAEIAVEAKVPKIRSVAQKHKSLETPGVVPSLWENGDIPQSRDCLWA